MRKSILLTALTLSLSLSPALSQRVARSNSGVSVQRGVGGAASSVDVRATNAALEVLRSGGNAIDATIAAAATLNVTEPFSCGIGGGGFMVVYSAADQKVYTVDSRETAPSSIRANVFKTPDGADIPFSPERISSGIAVGVPGTLGGWDLALKKWGTKPLSRLLQPAIRVALLGFDADATYVGQVNANLARFGVFPDTAKLFLTADGKAPAVGALIKNPELANTFRLIAAKGVGVMYGGELGQDVAALVRRPRPVENPPFPVRSAQMSVNDLLDYKAVLREPTVSQYRGLTVYGMGTPSSGGLSLGYALNLLSGFDLGVMPREKALHTYLEASRLAFVDRGAYLGDGDVVRIPARGLLSPAYADARRGLIGEKALEGVKPGNPFKFEGGTGSVMPARADTEGLSTTHLVVTDAAGNIVSYTFTIESTGGSAMVVPGRGFLLNNELTDFDTDPSSPNAPAPFKRPRSSMSPTLVFRDGKPLYALGSPGGSTIITTVLQTLVNLIDFKMPINASIDAARLSQRNSSTTSVEAGVDKALLEALTARGQKFGIPGEIGAATGVAWNADGTLTAAAEAARRGGGAAGVVTPQ